MIDSKLTKKQLIEKLQRLNMTGALSSLKATRQEKRVTLFNQP